MADPFATPARRVVPVPAWSVSLDGQDLTAKLQPRLVSLTLTEKRGEDADQLDLVVHDHDGLMAIPSPDAKLTVALGWLGDDGNPDLVEKGAFQVDEIEHAGAPDEITIRARSADFTEELRIRKTRSWKNTTLGAVLRQVAGEHALQPALDDGLAATALPVLDQSRESDGALLTRLGKRYDAVATVKSGRLVFAPIGKGKTSSGAALPDFTLTRRDGDRHCWKTAARDTYTGVRAYYHHVGSASRKSELAGKAGKVKELRQTYPTAETAKQAAKAELSRLARGAASFSLDLALGRPDLYPERKGSVSGWKSEIDGQSWLVAQAVHTMDGNGGFTTKLDMETP